MSFDIDSFDNVTSGMSKGPKIWSYGSTTDTLAQIMVPDYFEDVKDRLNKNDLIYVASIDDVELIKVTSENGQTPTTDIFVPASGGAPSDATYITQTPDVDLGNEQALSLLLSGILKSTTGTGVISIATPNTDYQVGSPALTSISGLTTAADQTIYTTASNTYATTGLTAAGRALIDDATAGDQRNSLGLGTIATQNSNNVMITGGSITGITDLAIADGGTNASTNTAAINNLVSGASLTTATVVGSDLLLIQDASDSNNLKSVTAQSVANLSAGGVTSVSGTADRITSTGGATPVIDIAATYVGQSSITTLGTIASGVWGSSATLIAPASGGTGIANTGTITVGGNTAFSGAFTFTGTVTANTAVTFPTSGTLQTTAGAAGIVNSGTANQLGYYASSGTTISGLASANNSILVTSGAGVPSISGTLPFTLPVTTGGTGVTTMTTAYAPVISGTTATGALQVASTGLATSGFVLTSNGASAVPSFQAVSAPAGVPVLVRVPLTLAQFLAIRATPFQIIAAQGANTIIVPISIVFELNMAGVAFAGGGDTGLQYGNTTSLGGPPIAFMAASNITAPSASPGQVVNLPVNFFAASGTVPGSVAKGTTVNTAVFASNKTAAYTGGTGATVVINVTYVVVTTT